MPSPCFFVVCLPLASCLSVLHAPAQKKKDTATCLESSCQDHDHRTKPIHIRPHPHTAPSGPRPPSSFFSSVVIQTSTGACASDEKSALHHHPSDPPTPPPLPMFATFKMPYPCPVWKLFRGAVPERGPTEIRVLLWGGVA